MKKLFNSSVWLRRLLLIAVIAPFIPFWGEVFTKILFPHNLDSRMNIYVHDPVIGFTYKPHAVTYEKGREYNALYQINSLGLRDREYGSKEDSIFRVLLLGDSFSVSHGLPIEESLSRQLERELQSLADQDEMSVSIEVVNGAAGGYSPYNYWKAYHRWAPILEPDVVVVGLSPDDFDSSNAGLKYLIEDGATMAILREGQESRKAGWSFSKELRRWLSSKSQFYILLRNSLYYNDLVGRVSQWISAREEERIGELQQYVVPQPENIDTAWTNAFSYLENLRDETADHGVILIVIPIPRKLEIDSEQYRQALVASDLIPQQVDPGQPLRVISAFCDAESIPLLDPRAAIREHHAEVPCYFVYDGHWNAEGIRVSAASLARQWSRLRLPPWDNTSPSKP